MLYNLNLFSISSILNYYTLSSSSNNYHLSLSILSSYLFTYYTFSSSPLSFRLILSISCLFYIYHSFRSSILLYFMLSILSFLYYSSFIYYLVISYQSFLNHFVPQSMLYNSSHSSIPYSPLTSYSFILISALFSSTLFYSISHHQLPLSYYSAIYSFVLLSIIYYISLQLFTTCLTLSYATNQPLFHISHLAITS